MTCVKEHILASQDKKKHENIFDMIFDESGVSFTWLLPEDIAYKYLVVSHRASKSPSQNLFANRSCYPDKSLQPWKNLTQTSMKGSLL